MTLDVKGTPHEQWGSRNGFVLAIDRHLINRIAGTALDVIIVAALATLSLTVIGDNFLPF